MEQTTTVDVHLYDIPSDNLKVILRGHPILSLRLVCKGLKTRIENFPNICISLSEAGSQNVTRDFFMLFKGNVTIGCNYTCTPLAGWFKAVLDAINTGLIVDRIISLDVNCNTIQVLSSDLKRAVHREGLRSSHIDRLCLSLAVFSKTGLESSVTALSALANCVRHIELNLELSYRRSRESLIEIIQLLRFMPKRVAITRLNIRWSASLPRPPADCAFTRVCLRACASAHPRECSL